MASLTRKELGQLLDLEIDLVAEGRQNRSGLPMRPTYVTIHNTSNTSKGADARAHARMVRDVGYYLIVDKKTKQTKKNWVSWHYTVDDVRAIKHLPINERGKHAGTAEGNRTSIGIEICMHKGIDQEAANLRAARLAAALLHDLRLPAANLRMHQNWSGKACPTLMLTTFEDFRARVQGILDALAAPPPLDGVVTEAEVAALGAADSAAESVEMDEPGEEDHEGIGRMVDKANRKGILGLFGL